MQGGAAAAAQAPKLSTFVGVLLGLSVLTQNAVTGVPRICVTRGNRKISSLSAILSLPPPTTCPGAGICLLFCYYFKVLKGLAGVVLAALNSNFKASLRDDFVDRMVAKLQKMEKIVAVRVHDGGDFYCQAYINKWVKIAKRLPWLKFFAYTKSLHLNLAPLEALPNFTLIRSEGGLFDSRIDKSKDNYAVVIENLSKKKADVKACPADLPGVKLNGDWCGLRCNDCLPPNGTRNGEQIRLAFIERVAGWNGMPDEAVDRLKGLIEHGLIKPQTSTQARRLQKFVRCYMNH